MGHVRVKLPGTAGKIEARALAMHRAVMASIEQVAASKRPKPTKPARKTFAHIRDYREVIR